MVGNKNIEKQVEKIGKDITEILKACLEYQEDGYKVGHEEGYKAGYAAAEAELKEKGKEVSK